MRDTIKRVAEAIERKMFGATAEERVAMQMRLSELIAENTMYRMVAALEQDEDEADEREDEGQP